MRKLIFALMFAPSVIGIASPAHASPFGCKVLLCLSNPASNGGPKGPSDCVEPITQLYHDLSKGRPFPTCDLADGNDGSSYAGQVYDAYDPCPATLRPAARGSYVVQKGRARGNESGRGGNGLFDMTSDPQVSEPKNDYSSSIGARACVGHPVGSYTAGTYDNAYTVTVYDKVIWQPAQSPRAIDVFIDNRWQQRVRY